MPAAAVIPAPEAYANVAAVERLAVELYGNSNTLVCGSRSLRRCKLIGASSWVSRL